MNTDVKNHSVAFGWVGIAAIAAFCIMWLACFQADGFWTWGVNSLSDFGVSATAAADYFNYGCIVCGVLFAIYGVGKIHYARATGYQVSGIMFVLAGICFVMVGIFTKDFHHGDYHYFFAVLSFIFFTAALLAGAIQQYYDGMVLPVGAAIIILLTVILMGMTFTFAEAEVWAAVAFLIWGIIDAGLLIATGIKGGKQ
ncbi:MAG: DUF998 domain-containing protein [archaeon]|nr:DUF998 domain-containing protein [archaeon]